MLPIQDIEAEPRAEAIAASPQCARHGSLGRMPAIEDFVHLVPQRAAFSLFVRR